MINSGLYIHDLPLFITASILIVAMPGPDVLYVLGRSTTGGRNAGIWSALGVATGNLIHTTAATLGISALLLTSAWLFTIVKIIGACYLFYLGIQMLRTRKSDSQIEVQPKINLQPVSSKQIFLQGMLTDVLNPKSALFYITFLPQFIDGHAPNRISSLICLGLLFVIIGLVNDLILAIFSSFFSNSLKRSPGIKRWLDRVFGCILVGLGVRLAFERR
jgi:RhtB (resistance to homoserine/threonine) family protein